VDKNGKMNIKEKWKKKKMKREKERIKLFYVIF
jgi:hypothetical protein